MSVGSTQPATCRCRRRIPAAASSSSMTSCSSAAASRPHGRGQCGLRASHRRPARCSTPPSGSAATSATSARTRSRSSSASPGSSSAQVAPATGHGCRHDRVATGTPTVRRVGQQRGSAQVQVGVVLPRVADPPEHLDARPWRSRRPRGGERCRGGHRQGELLVGGVQPGGIPGGGPGQLQPAQRVGATVLHRLELPIGTVELLAGARPLRGRVHAPAGHADRLGRRQQGRQVDDRLRGQAKASGGRPPDSWTPGHATGRVRAGDGRSGEVVARPTAPSGPARPRAAATGPRRRRRRRRRPRAGPPPAHRTGGARPAPGRARPGSWRRGP